MTWPTVILYFGSVRLEFWSPLNTFSLKGESSASICTMSSGISFGVIGCFCNIAIMNEEETTTLGYKKYNSHTLFSKAVKSLVGVWEINGDKVRRRQTAITWLITSFDHTTMYFNINIQGPIWHFFFFLARRYSTGGSLWVALWDTASAGRPDNRWGSLWLTESLLVAN